MIGSVYKLVCPNTKNILYVGSTKGNYISRGIDHLYKIKKGKEPLYQYCRDNNMIPLIELVEEYEYEKIKELRNREKYWIRELGVGGTLLNQKRYLYPIGDNLDPELMTIRLKAPLKEKLIELAAERNISLNKLVCQILEEYLREHAELLKAV